MLGDSERVRGRSCWEILRESTGGLAGRFWRSDTEVLLRDSDGVGRRSCWEFLIEWMGDLAGRLSRSGREGFL